MKNDTSKVIDLDSMLSSEEKPVVVENTQPEPISVDWDSILAEWSYRCPKGYPTVVDGVFTEREEVIILNEVLASRGLPQITLEAARQRPNTGSNETSLKEGLVCFFYDILKQSDIASLFFELHTQALSKSTLIDKKSLAVFTQKITRIYTTNSKFYGVGKSMPTNLPNYISYCLESKQELDTITNGASAAQTIQNEISSTGRIIRDQTFESIRSLASKLIKEQFKLNVLPDNWCPGDVYLVVNPGAEKEALQAETLNIGKDSLNAQFQKKTGIVAVSLKEEKAQAGKATTFADTVFSNTFAANLDPNLKYGTSDNKTLAKLAAKISRYEDYYTGAKGGKRRKSYINAVSKDGKIHGSINTILQAANLPTRKTGDIKFVANEEGFLKANKALFKDLNIAVEKLKKKMGGADSIKKVESGFINSRKTFLKDLAKYKVEIDATDSTQFAKAIQKENEEPVSVLSKKQAAYELAVVIMDRWVDKNAKISPAYKKIQEVTNPFVALTAFAIAQAGISPSFWKVIGSARNPKGGHGDFFDSKLAVDIDTKTSKIQLVDSTTQSGFLLKYTTIMGDKRYSTKLVFRFSGSEIRIEVQELKKI